MRTTDQLLQDLDNVIAIPVVPFRDGAIDRDGHQRNIQYLMKKNHLEGNRPRVISVAGTSLLHHLSCKEQVQIFEDTGHVMGDEGILMTAVIPNPLADVRATLEQHMTLARVPDVILIMPLSGTFSPEGLYEGLMALGAEFGPHGARFLYYLRASRDMGAVLRLLTDSPYFVGVKVGTGLEDVPPMVNQVTTGNIVIWGIGDRSTDAARLGTKGHTSGTAVVTTKPCDSINNAQRRQDWNTAYAWETKLAALEEIRFRNGRAYNYSAVVEALNQLGDDVCGGEGGPFNPGAGRDLQAEVKSALSELRELH